MKRFEVENIEAVEEKVQDIAKHVLCTPIYIAVVIVLGIIIFY